MLSLSGAIHTAWAAYQRNWKLWIPLGVLSALLMLIPLLIFVVSLEQGKPCSTLTQCTSAAWQSLHYTPSGILMRQMHTIFSLGTAILMPGLMATALKDARGERPHWSDFWGAYHWRRLSIWVRQAIYSGRFIMLGLLCFVVPGCILYAGFFFSGWLVLAAPRFPEGIKRTRLAIASLKASWGLTKGMRWDLFAILWLLFLFQGIAYLSCGLFNIMFTPLSVLTEASLFYQCLAKDPGLVERWATTDSRLVRSELRS